MLKKFRFLVVDDEPDIVEFISDVLSESFSCEIFAAGDGLAGYEIAKTEKLDLVITDYRMPLMDGGAMVLAIRKKTDLNKEVPILMVSAYIEDAKGQGMPDERILFIDKPVARKNLVRNAKFALAL